MTLQQEYEYSLFWQLMPSELNLKEIIKANPPKFVYSFDFFVHLVHLTIEIPAKNDSLRRSDGYVPLYSAILQQKNRDYALHLAYLVENKILEVRPYFTPGVKSRQYRIAENYLKDRLMEIMVSDKKLVKHLAKECRLSFKQQKKYAYLQQWFDDRIEIDADAAMAYCVHQLRQATYETLYELHQQVYGKMLMIKMLQHRQYWFTVDRFGKRLHTNLTTLSSDLRQFVRYAGQDLVSVDIKNSQPYLSLMLLKPEEKVQNITSIPNNLPTPHPTTLPITLVKEAESVSGIDVQRYTDLVVSGTLYEYMEAEIRKAFGDSYFTKDYFDVDSKTWVKDMKPRDRVKKIMFQVFFSKNKTRTPEKKLFTKLFPSVMSVFEAHKAKRHVKIIDRHKRLARELQQAESRIMLDKVAKEVSRLRPGIPLFTIHDCIVTTVGNEDFVQDVMTKIITAEVGYPPSLKPEYWCTDCRNGQIQAA